MKWTELRQMTDAALQSELYKFSEELRNLRFQKAIGPLENPQALRKARRATARINTIIQERRAGEQKKVKAVSK